jgi:hypothetical protein
MSQWSFKMLGEFEFMIDDKSVLKQISFKLLHMLKEKKSFKAR